MKKQAEWIVAGALAILLAATTVCWASITTQDVDGQPLIFDQTNQITVVVQSRESLQKRTRQAGITLYPLHAHTNWKLVIVVDLRDSLARMAKGYTGRRMQRDLDSEAETIHQIVTNRSLADLRQGLRGVADFDGKTSDALGFTHSESNLGAVIFNSKGEVHRRWNDLTNTSELQASLVELLPSPESR